MNFEDAIQQITRNPSTSKLQELNNAYAEDIETFWENVIEPLLPDYNVMEKWHKLFIKYISLNNTVFMIRKGNDRSIRYMQRVPNDALRRGFLTKTNDGYDFTYNDNDFATYILEMTLNNNIIYGLNENELKNYLTTPNATIRFNKSCAEEREKAFFKINGRPSHISKKGYTLAHIFDVNNHYYDKNMGIDNLNTENILGLPSVNITRGRYSEYKLQNNGFIFRTNYNPGKNARKFLEAHMLRFLHPLNYFCVPKDKGNNRIYCEFIDCINNVKSNRISGYEHLLYYAHYKFKEKYKDIYDDYLKRIMLPDNSFDFFEKSKPTADYYGTEKINIQYGNPLKDNQNVIRKSSNINQWNFEDFRKYALKNNGISDNTLKSYINYIRFIMNELEIRFIDELEQRIEDAINYCTDKIENSVELKSKKLMKKYSDCRSALRKYQDFLLSKLISSIYIDWSKGWQSFIPKDEFLYKYCIKGNIITISYTRGFNGIITKEKTEIILNNDMKKLIKILNFAKNNGLFEKNNDLFEKNNASINTINGHIDSYTFKYCDIYGNNCRRLFTNDKINDEFSELIYKYID